MVSEKVITPKVKIDRNRQRENTFAVAIKLCTVEAASIRQFPIAKIQMLLLAFILFLIIPIPREIMLIVYAIMHPNAPIC